MKFSWCCICWEVGGVAGGKWVIELIGGELTPCAPAQTSSLHLPAAAQHSTVHHTTKHSTAQHSPTHLLHVVLVVEVGQLVIRQQHHRHQDVLGVLYVLTRQVGDEQGLGRVRDGGGQRALEQRALRVLRYHLGVLLRCEGGADVL